MRVHVYPSFESLPVGYGRLFDQQARDDLFASRIWRENNASHGRGAAEELRLYGVEEAGQSDSLPLALFVAVASRQYPAHRNTQVVNFSSGEGGLFTPVTRVVDGISRQALLMQVVSEIRDSTEPHDVLRFGSLDSDSELFGELIEVMRDAGQICQAYGIYTNRYVVTEGMSFSDYLRSRPASFRKTLNRRQRRLEESERVRFELVTGGEELESIISDCARILATCWREPELDPMGHIAGMIRASASAGALRLGMLYFDSQPVAYQLCVVSAGVAYFLRTAYDRRFKHQSVGAAVIHRVVEHVLDADRVNVIDFGPGDQPYKSYWAPECRERMGLVAFNPRTVRGLRAIARHVAGRTAKQYVERSRRALGKLVRRPPMPTGPSSARGT